LKSHRFVHYDEEYRKAKWLEGHSDLKMMVRRSNNSPMRAPAPAAEVVHLGSGSFLGLRILAGVHLDSGSFLGLGILA
jgi:hypothetical protein